MKNIGTYAPIIVIVALVVAAVFGVRVISHPADSSSEPQFASMNLSSIMASPNKLSVEVNQTSGLIVYGVFTQNGSSNGAMKVVTNNLSFVSSNVQVATVNSSLGRITGVSVGTTTITVSYTEGSVTKKLAVPVTVIPVYQP